MQRIYVITVVKGEYEDREWYQLFAMENQAQAEIRRSRLQEAFNAIEERRSEAINKNKFPDRGYGGTDYAKLERSMKRWKEVRALRDLGDTQYAPEAHDFDREYGVTLLDIRPARIEGSR